MKRKSLGFTMIELIVIIVVIGILSAVAIPRFINQTSNARIAALNGLNGAIQSARTLANVQYKAEANPSSTSIDMDGTAVTVVAGSGNPTASAAGIGTALSALSGFTASYAAGVATFDFSSPISSCNLAYNETTGEVTLTTTGC